MATKNWSTIIIVLILIVGAIFILPKVLNQTQLFSITGGVCGSGSLSTIGTTECYRSGYDYCKQIVWKDPEKSTRCYRMEIAYTLKNNVLSYSIFSRNLYLYESTSQVTPVCNLGTGSGRDATCDGTILENYDSTNGKSSPYIGSYGINPLNTQFKLVAIDKGQNPDSTNYYGNILMVDVIPTCTPQCSGKSCGNDGCGGSCGACGSGQSCNSGVCTIIPTVYGDSNGDGKVDRNELGVVISGWVAGTLTRDNLGISINSWSSN
jgi:hypothetical protein